MGHPDVGKHDLERAPYPKRGQHREPPGALPLAQQGPCYHDEHATGHDGVDARHEDVKTDVVAGEERTGLRTPEPCGTGRGEDCVFK